MSRPLLILLFVLIIAGLKGQEGLLDKNRIKNLIVKEWSVNDGLASNSIRKIGKTKDGHLLVATYHGLSLFDGKNFNNFSKENEESIKSNSVYDFCVDSDSVFWIATYHGVVCYDGNRFYIKKGLEPTSKLNIQCINIDQDETIWLGTTSNGLYKYRNGQLSKVNDVKGLEKNIISLLFVDKLNLLWVGTENGDLYKYDGKKFFTIYSSKISNGIFVAAQNPNSDYYFGTRNGLFTLKNDSLVLVTENINFINDLKFDDSGNLWIATNSGLYLYEETTQKLVSVFKKAGLNNQIVQTFYFENDENIWVGSYRKGLMQLRIGAFQNYPFSLVKFDEVPSAIALMGDNAIWVGTDEGTLLELKNGIYNKINLQTDIRHHRIKCIIEDSKKNKWICSYGGLLKLENGKEALLSNSNGFLDNTFRAIIETPGGDFWVGTRQTGLYLIDGFFNVKKKINTSNGLSSNFVMSIVQGNNGKIFVATKNGVDILVDNELVGHYDTKQGLVDNLVFNVYEDADNVLWLATIGGLSRIENGKFTNYTTKNGLLDDKIFDVVEDKLGFLWLPTINGIMRIEKQQANDYANNKTDKVFSVIYDKSDGMHDQQYVGASKALKSINGSIVLNTISGISILDPEIANNTSSKQVISISDLSTNRMVYLPGKHLIEIPSSDKYLQINYSYIDFVNPDKVEFTYQLEPFDSKWQNAGTERNVRYTNLSPGTYTFRLKALVKSSGKVLEQQVQFKITPSFFESVWFKLIAVLVFLLIFWAVYFIRIGTIKRQKRHLENEVAKRTEKISQQKEAIEQHVDELEAQKTEIAIKTEEVLIARNKIEQAYINLKLLSELGKEITSLLSEVEIAKKLQSNLNTLMNIDLLSIAITDSENDITLFTANIYQGKIKPAFNRPLYTEKCIISHSIINDIDIISNNFKEDYPVFDTSFPNMSSIKTFTSLIVVPIRIKEDVVGMLTTQCFRKGAYSDFHFNLLQNLAIYVGIAFENIKTYRKIELQKDELQQANAAKDRMFSIIGHDLRNPVGTIKTFLDLILENPEMTNTENTLKILQTMQQSLGSAYTLLDNLLLWARNQRGQMEYKPQKFFIRQPIDESISLVIESAKAKKITVDSKVDFNSEVFADQNMITTVLRNLVSNAIKFTAENGHVEIRTSKHRKETDGKTLDVVEVAVIDNGIGISEENIEKIMQVNEMFSTPGTNKEQGSGLGIGICIDFLNKHGQILHVENNKNVHNKSGTIFKFYLNTT